MEISKMPLIYENLRISRIFYLSKYIFWSNPMLLQSEGKKILKLKITVLAIFWVWNSSTSHNIWLWFQSSGNSKKCLFNEWIKTLFSIPWCTSVWHWTFHWRWVFRTGLPKMLTHSCALWVPFNIAKVCQQFFQVLSLDICLSPPKRERHAWKMWFLTEDWIQNCVITSNS